MITKKQIAFEAMSYDDQYHNLIDRYREALGATTLPKEVIDTCVAVFKADLCTHINAVITEMKD